MKELVILVVEDEVKIRENHLLMFYLLVTAR